MAKSATHFQPTTDTFGDLTLHARRIGSRFLAAGWIGTHSGTDRRNLINFLTGFAFVLGFVVMLAGIGMVDQAAFAGSHDAGQTYYGGIPLDYD